MGRRNTALLPATSGSENDHAQSQSQSHSGSSSPSPRQQRDMTAREALLQDIQATGGIRDTSEIILAARRLLARGERILAGGSKKKGGLGGGGLSGSESGGGLPEEGRRVLQEACELLDPLVEGGTGKQGSPLEEENGKDKSSHQRVQKKNNDEGGNSNMTKSAAVLLGAQISARNLVSSAAATDYEVAYLRCRCYFMRALAARSAPKASVARQYYTFMEKATDLARTAHDLDYDRANAGDTGVLWAHILLTLASHTMIPADKEVYTVEAGTKLMFAAHNAAKKAGGDAADADAGVLRQVYRLLDLYVHLIGSMSLDRQRSGSVVYRLAATLAKQGGGTKSKGWKERWLVADDMRISYFKNESVWTRGVQKGDMTKCQPQGTIEFINVHEAFTHAKTAKPSETPITAKLCPLLRDPKTKTGFQNNNKPPTKMVNSQCLHISVCEDADHTNAEAAALNRVFHLVGVKDEDTALDWVKQINFATRALKLKHSVKKWLKEYEQQNEDSDDRDHPAYVELMESLYAAEESSGRDHSLVLGDVLPDWADPAKSGGSSSKKKSKAPKIRLPGQLASAKRKTKDEILDQKINQLEEELWRIEARKYGPPEPEAPVLPDDMDNEDEYKDYMRARYEKEQWEAAILLLSRKYRAEHQKQDKPMLVDGGVFAGPGAVGKAGSSTAKSPTKKDKTAASSSSKATKKDNASKKTKSFKKSKSSAKVEAAPAQAEDDDATVDDDSSAEQHASDRENQSSKKSTSKSNDLSARSKKAKSSKEDKQLKKGSSKRKTVELSTLAVESEVSKQDSANASDASSSSDSLPSEDDKRDSFAVVVEEQASKEASGAVVTGDALSSSLSSEDEKHESVRSATIDHNLSSDAAEARDKSSAVVHPQPSSEKAVSDSEGQASEDGSSEDTKGSASSSAHHSAAEDEKKNPTAVPTEEVSKGAAEASDAATSSSSSEDEKDKPAQTSTSDQDEEEASKEAAETSDAATSSASSGDENE